MTTILVPCDGSDNALRAVRHAASKALAAREATTIELLYVLAPFYAVAFREPLCALQLDDGFPPLAHQALHQAVALLGQHGVRHQVCCRWGATEAVEVLAHARAQRCAAIVMGTRGRNALASLVLGSVATEVAHTADVPVTFVK